MGKDVYGAPHHEAQGRAEHERTEEPLVEAPQCLIADGPKGDLGKERAVSEEVARLDAEGRDEWRHAYLARRQGSRLVQAEEGSDPQYDEGMTPDQRQRPQKDPESPGESQGPRKHVLLKQEGERAQGVQHGDLVAFLAPADPPVGKGKQSPHGELRVEHGEPQVVPDEGKMGDPLAFGRIEDVHGYFPYGHTRPGGLRKHFHLEGVSFFMERQVAQQGQRIGAKTALGIVHYAACLKAQPEIRELAAEPGEGRGIAIERPRTHDDGIRLLIDNRQKSPEVLRTMLAVPVESDDMGHAEALGFTGARQYGPALALVGGMAEDGHGQAGDGSTDVVGAAVVHDQDMVVDAQSFLDHGAEEAGVVINRNDNGHAGEGDGRCDRHGVCGIRCHIVRGAGG